MIYETDILSRRNLIVDAFRVLRAWDRKKKFKLMCKRHDSEVLLSAIGCASVAEGNCAAAKEDWVDAQLSEAFGWKTIQALRQESIEALKKEMHIS